MDIEKRRAALIDMDGVLYDSMKYHTLAWRQMMGEYGLDIPRDEFYLYEGMTGAATIDLIWEREFGKRCDPGQIERSAAQAGSACLSRGRRRPRFST